MKCVNRKYLVLKNEVVVARTKRMAALRCEAEEIVIDQLKRE